MVKLSRFSVYVGFTCVLSVGTLLTLLILNTGLLFEKQRKFHQLKFEHGVNVFKREPDIVGKSAFITKYLNQGLIENNGIVKCLTCNSRVNTSRYKNYVYFSGTYSLNVTPMTSWVRKENIFKFCDDKVTIYNDLFAILHNARLDPTRRDRIGDQAKGGEEIKDTLNQKLDKEDYSFKNDFLEIECSLKTDLGAHVQTFFWAKSLTLVTTKTDQNSDVWKGSGESYVVAVRRQDYANLHNWVRNIYNTFLMMIHFKIQPVNISIIFMDGHPRTDLDKSWEIIYGRPLRVGQMSKPIQYQNFILSLQENEGPVTEFQHSEVPYLEEFRSFVLSQFSLVSAGQLDCSKLRITVIIRRNAVYHPRNIAGNVGRKIFNEAELINDLMHSFPRACVKPSLMEALPMMSQLDLIRQTDVLIGMHGAGMSHVMFLPKHAGVLELFTKGFKNGRPWFDCFHSITKWRNMAYDSWENFNSSLEMPHDFTILPTDVIVNKTKGIINKICPL